RPCPAPGVQHNQGDIQDRSTGLILTPSARSVPKLSLSVKIDAFAQWDRTPFGSYIPGIEPVPKLLRIPNGGTQRKNLDSRINLTQPRHDNLQSWASRMLS